LIAAGLLSGCGSAALVVSSDGSVSDAAIADATGVDVEPSRGDTGFSVPPVVDAAGPMVAACPGDGQTDIAGQAPFGRFVARAVYGGYLGGDCDLRIRVVLAAERDLTINQLMSPTRGSVVWVRTRESLPEVLPATVRATISVGSDIQESADAIMILEEVSLVQTASRRVRGRVEARSAGWSLEGSFSTPICADLVQACI
jgi:hypothetical protein